MKNLNNTNNNKSFLNVQVGYFMNTNRLSIALCTFNGSRYLSNLLASLTEQHLFPLELIICDDASTDSLLSKVKLFASESLCPVTIIDNKKGWVS